MDRASKLREVQAHGFTPVTKGQGYMHGLASVSYEFIDFAKHAPGPVVDIGAAYGNATIPALQNGGRVIACDIEKTHLDKLVAQVPKNLLDQLELCIGRFPNDYDFDDNSIGAVLIAHVFPLLDGSAIEQGVAKMYEWLHPGGKVFSISYTPYNAIFSSFIPIYESRRAVGQKWPGYIEDIYQYCKDSAYTVNLPKSINQMDVDILKDVFQSVGFIVEKAEYITDHMEVVPEEIRLDGRERVGIIAVKG